MSSHLSRLDLSDIELAVDLRGSGLPVVFVHGFPLDRSMWREQLPAISDCFRTITPDLRGFGQSTLAGDVSTMEQMAQDLSAMLDQLGVTEPVVLCGLSMGGYVAFEFWRQFAERLAGLVLCDTRAVPDSSEAAQGRHELAAKVLVEGPAPVAEAMLPKLFAKSTIEHHPGIWQHERAVILNTSREGIAAAARGMAARRDARGWLSQIAVPTLVLVGEHDAISTVDEMRGIASGIPNAEFVIIPDAGHMAPLEQPARTNEALQKFLKRVAG